MNLGDVIAVKGENINEKLEQKISSEIVEATGKVCQKWLEGMGRGLVLPGGTKESSPPPLSRGDSLGPPGSTEKCRPCG
eukprot:gene26215-biopygen14958